MDGWVVSRWLEVYRASYSAKILWFGCRFEQRTVFTESCFDSRRQYTKIGKNSKLPFLWCHMAHCAESKFSQEKCRIFTFCLLLSLAPSLSLQCIFSCNLVLGIPEDAYSHWLHLTGICPLLIFGFWDYLHDTIPNGTDCTCEPFLHCAFLSHWWLDWVPVFSHWLNFKCNQCE